MRTSARSRGLIIGLALSLLSSAATALAEPPDQPGQDGLPLLQQEDPVPGGAVPITPLPDGLTQENAAVSKPEWPSAGSSEVALPAVARGAASEPVKAGALPVWLGRGESPDRAAGAAAGRVKVELLDADKADAAGVRGVLVRLSPKSGDTAGLVNVRVDYRGFAEAFGGDYGRRLTLVACALSTPDRPDCAQSTPVSATNSTSDQYVAGNVQLDSDEPTLLAVTAEPSGPTGDFKATSLSPSGSWSVGGSSGEFTYSYPFRLPAALGGEAPSVALGYSSGAVDGRTVSTNNQASWVGDGWDLGSGFIERRYKSCSDDGRPNKGDLCWGTDNATMSLNGVTTELIRNPNTGYWHPKQDDGSRIERLTGAANGARDGEHWKVTTRSGTQYVFGLYRLPGWAEGKTETRSVWTVPVFGNDPGEPCHQETWCQQAYRWNLDYVVDTHGNATGYFYEREGNFYARDGNVANSSIYIRGGWLAQVNYGLRSDNLYATPPGFVRFGVTERCVPTPTFDCAAAKLTASTATHWPDVPFDQICNAGEQCTNRIAPGFFTRKRLALVSTFAWNGTATEEVDSWRLNQSFPTAADGLSPSLWLNSIVHTGLVGADSKTLPATSFEPLARANRVDAVDNRPPLTRNRIVGVVNESGGYIAVRYAEPECVAGSRMPANPQTNTMRCFPQWWAPRGAIDPILDYFHKYVVTDVTVDSRTGGSPSVGGSELMKTHYDYLDGGAWHFDDNDLAPADKRTWSQWRGYGKVKVTEGEPTGKPSVTETTYLRGMDGDRLPTGTRDIWVTDPTDNTARIEDHSALAGHQWVTVNYEDRPAGLSVASVSKAVPWVSAPTAGSGDKQAFFKETAGNQNRTALASGTWRRTETKTTFNDNGIPTMVEDLGDLDAGGDETCVVTDYARNETAWLLTFPKSVRTVFDTCGVHVAPGIKLREVRTSYDGAAWGVAPTIGNATRVDELDTWTTSGQTWVTTARTSYDAYGRQVEAIDAGNNKTTTVYSPATGALPTKVTKSSPLNHVTTVTFEPSLALPLKTVGPSGAASVMQYDALGRLVRGWRPGRDPQFVDPDVVFEYQVNQNAASVVTTKNLLDGGVYLTSHALFDGLGRARQTQAPAPGAAGGRVVTDTLYDSRGLAYLTNHPYWTSQQPSTTLFGVANNNVPRQTVTEFDRLKRPTNEIYRSLNVEQWRTIYAYGGDRVHMRPPGGGTATTTVTDVRGNVTELRQYHAPTVGGPYDATKYTYQRGTELASIEDADKNIWRFGYDLRGRKISADDPDRGHTDNVYDALDRLTSTTDARGKTLAYSYDALGRKTGTFDGSTSGTKLAEWTYDTIRTGLPTASTRFADGRAYTNRVVKYNIADQPTETEIVIPQEETGLGKTYKYVTEYTSTTGKVSNTQLPAAGGLASEFVWHTYNNMGLPATTLGNIVGGGQQIYVANTEYSPYGEVLRMTQNAADSTANMDVTFSYQEATRRLTRTLTLRETASGYQAVTDRNYTYDPIGNVTSVADKPQGGTFDTQCFSYDYLRRLTQGWTPANGNCATAPTVTGLGGAAPYWTSWTYDKVSNRRTEINHAAGGDTTRTYTYPAAGQPRPHGVQSVATDTPGNDRLDTYAYDTAGNTITRSLASAEQTLDYNAEGQLAEHTDADGGTSNYVYDADGARLLKREPDATTLYLPGMELRRDATTGTVTSTRHYAHGGVDVATRTSAGVTWTVPDHQATVVATVNAQTMAVAKRFYDPFGNRRGQQPAVWPGAPRGFLNGPEDASGLTHLGARDYDPAIGRFLTVDPILDTANPLHFNAYTYSLNNPVTHADPSGLFCDSCDFYSSPEHPSAWGPGGSSGVDPQELEDYKIRTGQNKDPNKQPKIAGIRIPTFDDLKKYHQLHFGEGMTYEEIVRDWAQWMCMGPSYDANFCTQAKAYGLLEQKHDFGDIAEFLYELTPIADLIDCANQSVSGCAWLVAGLVPGSKILKGVGNVADGAKAGAKAADNFGDPGKALDDIIACARSFTSETQVLMADGTTTPISQINVGDQVLAANPDTGEQGPRTVTAVWVHQDVVMDLLVEGGGKISTTEDHPFYNTTDEQWQRADQLDPGDQLWTTGATAVRVAGLRPETRQTAAAYNLTVRDIHTYYVGAGDKFVLVHNDRCEWNAKTTLPSGGTVGDVGQRVWGHGLPSPDRLAGMTDEQIRGLASRDDALMLRDMYAQAAADIRSNATAPIRVRLAQQVIDAWER